MAQPDTARLDAVLADAARAADTLGAQAALLREGTVLWTGRYGVTDLTSQAPVTDDTVFCLASLGKTLVATLALNLVEEGRLELDVPISSVLGDEVPGSHVVTPRMLLSHTSGYPDLYDTPAIAALMAPDEDEPGSGAGFDPDRAFSWAMLVPGILEPVDPGARWEYSNAGYIVLAEMLVRLHGGAAGLKEAWGSIAARADARLGDDVLTLDRSTVGPLAHGYDRKSDGRLVDPYAAHPATGVPTDLFGLPFGDGLFAGTATGVGRFLDGLLVRRAVLRPETVDLMTTSSAQAAAGDVPDPDLATYGLGIYRIGAGSGVWHGHRGTYAGFATVGASEREGGSTLVVLANVWASEHPGRVIWGALAGELLGEDVTGAGAAG
jgi:CubicO group peptidase (beta-lactamase class C family)